MAGGSKGFLNQNRFKSGKAIKRQAKLKTEGIHNKSAKREGFDQSK